MLPGVEPENVWRKRDYRCTVIDIPLPSSSLKTADTDTLVAYYQRSLLRIDFLWTTDDTNQSAITGGCGLFVGGTKILFMSHFCLKKYAPPRAIELYGVRITYYAKNGLEMTRSVGMDKLQVEYFDDEMSIIDFPAIPPQRAIQINIPDRSMLSYQGPAIQIGRQKQGTLVVARAKKIWCEEFMGQPAWVVTRASGPNPTTIQGDCGSLLIALTNAGPVLVGLHLYLNQECTKSYSYNLCGKNFGTLISCAPPDLSRPGKVGNLGELHERSIIRYVDALDGVNPLGSFDGFRAATKSHVEDTIGAKFLQEVHGFVKEHGQPVMRGYGPRYRHLGTLNRTNASIPQYKIERMSKIFIDHVMKHRKADWRAFILSQHDAINGVPGHRFIDRIPINTSVGYPFRGPKTNFITPKVEGDWTSELFPNEEMQQMIDFCFERWSNGLQASPIFTASLKDEPRKFSKIDEKNTRVFFGGPAAFIIAQRQIFTWFTRLVQTNPVVFMQAPGMDANGSQWDLLAKYLLKHDNYIAGDFKDFDMSMVVQVLRQAYSFIIELGQLLGASEQHVLCMRAAAEDLVHPLIDYFGDLVQGTGKNPSGQALTVHINGIVNALYMIFCYCELHPDAKKDDARETVLARGANFFKDTRFIFYGDDNLGSVSNDAPWFNHTSISQLLGAHDVVYTMADKGAESVPYITFKEVTFLKRWFRYEPEVEGYVAPLDEASIRKALLMHIPSGVVSNEFSYAQTIAGQNDAMWHHGREKFEKFREILLELIEHCGIEEYFNHRGNKPILADWEELTSRWKLSRYNQCNLEWCLPRESAECERWIAQGRALGRGTMQSDSHYESRTACQLCWRCPYILGPHDAVQECLLCGGCRIDWDPWCIVCQEDGYCHCGARLMVNRRISVTSDYLYLYLACPECETIRLRTVPITRSIAEQYGVNPH
jgi:hypothetical protein